jgi:hypothetical protein
MTDRWCTRDGWSVEVIQVTATPDLHDGESFRVCHHGYHVGYARSIVELEQWIDLADLEEALSRALSRAAAGDATAPKRSAWSRVRRSTVICTTW